MTNASDEIGNFPQNLDEAMEFYRKRLVLTNNPVDMVMTRFYHFDTNKCRPMMVERSTIYKIIERYGSNGYIYFTACNQNTDRQTNDTNTRKLLNDINNSPYKYLPVYVSYEEWVNGSQHDFGISFIIFNCNAMYESQDLSELVEFGAELCHKYTDSFLLIKAAGEDPIMYNALREEVDRQNRKNMYLDTTSPEFYVNPSPCDRNEEIMRHSSGEIIVMRQIFDEWLKTGTSYNHKPS